MGAFGGMAADRLPERAGLRVGGYLPAVGRAERYQGASCRMGQFVCAHNGRYYSKRLLGLPEKADGFSGSLFMQMRAETSGGC